MNKPDLYKKKPTSMICSNPRFYCLSKPYWDGVSQSFCECGCERFDIGSAEGGRLKVLRKQCRTALSHGDIRNQTKPSLCSKFADPVRVMLPINCGVSL